jgi:hypothetical protein
MFTDFPFNPCFCDNQQTCNHYYASNQIANSINFYWEIREEYFRKKQYAFVKPEPIPYYRHKPQPLPFPRKGGRGMMIRRTKPWNLRNH